MLHIESPKANRVQTGGKLLHVFWTDLSSKLKVPKQKGFGLGQENTFDLELEGIEVPIIRISRDDIEVRTHEWAIWCPCLATEHRFVKKFAPKGEHNAAKSRYTPRQPSAS